MSTRRSGSADQHACPKSLWCCPISSRSLASFAIFPRTRLFVLLRYWLVLEEHLIRNYLKCLRGARLTVEDLHALPALPTVLVVVPHGDKGPSSASILQVWIV